MENKEGIEKNEADPINGNITGRDALGKFLPGNPFGSVEKKRAYNKEAFLDALQTVSKAKGKDYLLHILEHNWNNKAFHKVIIDKFVEDASITSLGKAIQIGNTIILQFTNYNPGADPAIKEAIIAKEAIFESVENKGQNGNRPSYGYKEGEE